MFTNTVLFRIIAAILISVAACYSQHANDTLLFSIQLDDDSSGLRFLSSSEPLRNSLSGPVLMKGHSFLFYSCYGYELYEKNGRLIESHSLIKKNRSNMKAGKPSMRLAYPLDSQTIMYYTEAGDTPGAEIPQQVFLKSIMDRQMNKTREQDTLHIYRNASRAQLFNLYHNGITDEMTQKCQLEPHLVGFSSTLGGKRWWALDNFYSFTSPLIMEDNGKYSSLFCGFSGGNSNTIKKSLAEPLGVFSINSTWYYLGVYSPGGSSRDEYTQKLFICDNAGNLLGENTILKTEIIDDVIGEDETEKLIYTVKRASKHVFLPAVDKNGDVYYGIIDYQASRIDVMQRQFFRYSPFTSPLAQEEELNLEQGFIYEENSDGRTGYCSPATPYVPRVLFTESGKSIRELEVKELIRKGFLARIMRSRNDALAKALSRRHSSLPAHIQSMQDSLSKLPSASCQYSVVLSKGEKSDLNSITYCPGDVIVCARILMVTSTFEIFVRVDLVDWAEIVIFSLDGQFLNRFRFNSENVEIRSDLIAVSPERLIIEKDYEVGKGACRYLSWKLGAYSSQ
jgi:hypothetical protein